MWSIETNSVQGAIGDLGIDQVVRERVSQAPDIVRFRHGGVPFDSDAVFPWGSSVKILRDGVVWFVGEVSSIDRAGSGDLEDIYYTLEGPWRWLNRLVFQQEWRVPEFPDQLESELLAIPRSRIILGKSIDNAGVDSMAVIGSVVSYAASAGAPLQLGNLPPGVQVPQEELMTPTCAEVVRKIMRWHPDVSSHFDYSVSPPRLHFTRRAAASPITVSSIDVQVSRLTDRRDLVPPAIEIQFERTNSIDDVSWSTVETQSAGVGGSKQPGALVLTVQLFGASTQTQSQRVKAESIQISSATWWRKRIPGLAEVSAEDIQVVEPVIAPAESEEDEYPESAPAREIVEGSAPPWLADQSWPVVASATLVVTRNGQPETMEVSVRLTGTNLQNRTYERVVSWVDQEPTPAGLADHLFAALSVVHWEGSITWEQEEIGADGPHPGRTLNITGSREAWANMAAQIQRVQEDVDAGRTVVTIGPPSHLGPQDLVELLRVNRTRQPSLLMSTRSSGRAHMGGKTEGSVSGANQDTVVKVIGTGPPPAAPLQITRQPNPNYAGSPESIPDSFFVAWGVVNGILPSNIDNAFELPSSGSRQVYLTISLSESSPYAVTAAEINVGSTVPSPAPFGNDGTWPSTAIYRLGQITRLSSGAIVISNTGSGSLQLSIFTRDWAPTPSGPQVRLSLAFSRG